MMAKIKTKEEVVKCNWCSGSWAGRFELKEKVRVCVKCGKEFKK